MNITLGTQTMQESLNGTNIIGTQWIIPIIIIFLTLLLITRETNRWLYLAFPVSIMWRTAQLKVHMLIIAIAGLFFVTKLIQDDIIGTLAKAIEKRPPTTEQRIANRELLRRAKESIKQKAEAMTPDKKWTKGDYLTSTTELLQLAKGKRK